MLGNLNSYVLLNEARKFLVKPTGLTISILSSHQRLSVSVRKKPNSELLLLLLSS